MLYYVSFVMISGRTSIIGEQRSASVFETPAMRPSA